MIDFGYTYEEGNPWYGNILETALNENYVPLDITLPDQLLTRAQMAEMIARILKIESGDLEELLGSEFDDRPNL